MLRKGYANNSFRQGLNMLPAGINLPLSRHAVIGVILVLALLAFEIFNFDSTRYALENLLGGAAFITISWATILAIAFCAIDFAGLAHLFTPQQGREEPREIWYLMGAWLLGATMNAIMTWWAVSLVLLNHDFGNEVLNRQQLLRYVPIFVAVLVWLTRILFIGAFSVAGDHLFRSDVTSRGTGLPAQSRSSAAHGRGRQPKPAMAAPPAKQSLQAAPKREPGGRTPHSRPGAPRGRLSRPGLQAAPRKTS